MAADSSAPLKRTPLYEEHLRCGARMTPFGGWDMPLQYAGQLAEHHAVRQDTGIFDVSHMGQVRFRGHRALEFLQLLVPGNCARLKDGDGLYTQLCTESGGVIDDLIVARLGEGHYFAVVNASTREKDVAWMRRQAAALGFADVSIEDESDQWAMIAVQGPEALAMLDTVVGGGSRWSETKAFSLHPFESDGAPHLLSRTGYTGEIGAELLCPPALAATWWKRFLDANAVPCGLAARDSLRLEMGYCLYGNDLDETTTPVEAGLSWSVGWKKTEPFLGHEVLKRQKMDGTARALTGIRLETRRPMRHGDELINEAGAKVGTVTSGGFSPILQVGIAMAYIDSAHLNTLGPTFLRTRSGGAENAIVTKPPFVQTTLTRKQS